MLLICRARRGAPLFSPGSSPEELDMPLQKKKFFFLGGVGDTKVLRTYPVTSNTPCPTTRGTIKIEVFV